MIKNEWQYKVTKARIADFENSLTELMALPPSQTQPWLRKAQRESLQLQIRDFRKQLSEYDELRSGKVKLPALETIEAMPGLLIKWRIVKGLNQEELADRIGVKKQQIQRYELDDYSTATVATICRVAEALMDKSPAYRASKVGSTHLKSTARSKRARSGVKLVSAAKKRRIG